ESESDESSAAPAESASGNGTSTLNQEDPGDGEESLDDDGYLGDSTSSAEGTSGESSEGHGGDR
ncbi:MAG TPA: hypothetical protein VF594_11885, partial [Rubricoccaceae bacterium]